MLVKHIVFSGGGLKGIAFLGVLEFLQRRNSLNVNSLETFAGSSAGALIAALLVIGYSVAEIFKLIYDVDVSSLIDPDVTKLLTLFGVESGHKFMNKFKEMFYLKGFGPDVSFMDLYQKTQKRLVVTASCLGKGIKYFDYENSPDMSVILALRMSIAIPLIFTAVQYKGDYYVDGGMLDNVPITVLKDKQTHTVLTIRIGYRESTGGQSIDLTDFIGLLIKTVMHEMESLRRQHKDYREHHEASIVVKTGGHKISITNADKKELFSQGYYAAKKYVQSQRFLLLQINALPYEIIRRIWSYKHRDCYRNVILELNSKAKR